MNHENTSPGGAGGEAPRSFSQFAKRVALVAAVALGIVLLIGAVHVFLLLFFAILFAVLLRSLSGWVAERTRISDGWSLALVSLGLPALFAGAVLLIAPRVGEQIGELRETLPASWQKLEAQLAKYSWGRQTLDVAQEADQYLPETDTLARKALGIFYTTAGALSSVLVVLFLGACLAIEPETYVGGFVRLVPKPRRQRARDVLAAIRQTLAWWFLAVFGAMTIVGVLTGVGLALLGIPLAFTLGLIAGLLAFIPNVGPIIAAIPAMLLAFTISPTSALHVALLFVAVQTVESYAIKPILERKTVSLPPALTGLVQLALGLSVGMLGVILAAPVTAAGIVLVRKLYVEDALGDRASSGD